eukprot:2054159-Prymnesium_polylepis.1
MLLDDIKNAPEEKKLLESAHGVDTEDAESILSSFIALTGRKSSSREMSRTRRMRSGRVQAL